MSLKSILRDVLNFFRRLARKFPDEIKEFTARALEITGAIKRLVDSEGVSTITAIIPGDWDDKLRDNIRHILAFSIPQIAKVEGCGTSLDCMLQLLIEFMREQSPKLRNSVLFSLASLIVKGLDHHRLRENQYDAYVQIGYSATKDVA